MDSFIPLSEQTIIEVLHLQSDRFSTFSTLLDETDVTQHLRSNDISRTVLAPTNDAFDRLPQGTLECLRQDENHRYLRLFVLLHISYHTEYSSTLSQRRDIRTLSRRYNLLVTVEDDSISLTRGKIMIEELDIPARNGVIHALPKPIVANEIANRCSDS